MFRILLLCVFAAYMTDARAVRLSSCESPLLGQHKTLEVIADNLVWAEGPVWSSQLNGLLFSDLGQDKILLWRDGPEPKLVTYIAASGHSGNELKPWAGSNGLLLAKNGELWIAQHGDRAVVSTPLKTPPNNSPFLRIVTNYKGNRLNSPNDLVQSDKGTLFFTDPPYGLSGYEKSKSVELPFFGVFRQYEKRSSNASKSAPKTAIPIVTDLLKPNGIALNKQQNLLYVSDSDESQNKIYRYELNEQEQVIGSKLFFDASGLLEFGDGSTDGLTVLENDMVLASVPAGIALLNKDGELLDHLVMGRVTNLEVDTAGEYLYITQPTQVVRVKLMEQGNRTFNCF